MNFNKLTHTRTMSSSWCLETNDEFYLSAEMWNILLNVAATQIKYKSSFAET